MAASMPWSVEQKSINSYKDRSGVGNLRMGPLLVPYIVFQYGLHGTLWVPEATQALLLWVPYVSLSNLF